MDDATDYGRGPRGHYDQANRAWGPDEDVSFAGDNFLFAQAMAQTRMAICISDARAPDQPIVFANRAFQHLTGYAREEVLGRNCRFLQGEDTDPATVAEIRRALAAEDVAVVQIVNYRKDGERFWNALHIGPIYDQTGALLYYFGSQWDVTEVRTARTSAAQQHALSRELAHRMSNMFGVVGGVVSITGRSLGAPDLAREINARVQALGRAYRGGVVEESTDEFLRIGAAIRGILEPFADGRAALEFEGPESLTATSATVMPLGLTLHELASNAVRHGALSTEGGRVRVTWGSAGKEGLHLTWDESGGPALTGAPTTQGKGTGITDTMVRTAGGTITRDWRPEGLRVVIDLPRGRAAATGG